MSNPIYLDNNSTTPVDSRVLEEMLPYFKEKFGNASSHQHRFGWIAEDGMNQALERISELIGSSVEDFIFTSGATESINLVLKGLYQSSVFENQQIITSHTEHSALLEPLEELKQKGVKVHYVPVDKSGLLDLNNLEEALNHKTALVAIMMANNETGVIQSISEISQLAHKAGSLFFTDATQAYGKIPFQVRPLGIDLMACSAHKIYGPKGIGGLYIHPHSPIKLKGQITGGGQQNNIRSGTLNIPGIVGFGKASELCQAEMKTEGTIHSQWRDWMEAHLLSIPYSHVNGKTQERLPNTLNIRFDYLRAEQLFSKIPEIAISSGSACNSANPEPSHVLMNMGLSEKQAKSSIRIGIGRMNTYQEILEAGDQIKKAVERLQMENPLFKKRG